VSVLPSAAKTAFVGYLAARGLERAKLLWFAKGKWLNNQNIRLREPIPGGRRPSPNASRCAIGGRRSSQGPACTGAAAVESTGSTVVGDEQCERRARKAGWVLITGPRHQRRKLLRRRTPTAP
jgi:hypothetical protein